MVEAKEAAEVIREVAGEHGGIGPGGRTFPKVVALLVALLAALLAVATISTGAATRRLLNDNIHLADLHASAGVMEVRQNNSVVTADVLQAMLDATNPAAAARTTIGQKIDAFKSAATDLEGDASKGTGVKGREQQISDYEGAEEHTESQILSFEYSEVALQIAIVLASLAILVASRAVFYVASTLGVAGLALAMNGFLSWTLLPTLH